jgi:hypothetical protein
LSVSLRTDNTIRIELSKIKGGIHKAKKQINGYGIIQGDFMIPYFIFTAKNVFTAKR